MDEPSHSSGVYRVKEDLLLKNFLENSRRDKAKVLRLQQVKNYDEWLQESIGNTLTRIRRSTSSAHSVAFSPSSLIQDAIKEGNKYEVLDLLSKGISINFSATQGEGMTLLHQACIYDDYIIAQALIKQGAIVDVRDDYGCTPLHICCMWDSLKCAQLLVSNNASVNVLDNDGNFAVDLAPENSHLKAMMKKHMQQKLKIDEGQLKSLRNRTQKRMLQDIRQLLEDGSSVDGTSSAGVSLLHIAVTNGYVSAARVLLENSANVNASDSHLWTPLHCAAKYSQVKMVRLLLSHYANPHSRTTSGFTPKELTKDSEIITMLSNAEDTFLDLDNQRTPAKPKRFSASLLDQFDDEDDITRVPSRIISSTRTCKRDVSNEKEIISGLGDELKRELKAEIEFQPPTVTSNFGFSIPTWKQMMPPPVPPRDDPPQVSSPLHPAIKPKIYYSTNKPVDETKLKAAVIIQRAYRHYKRLAQPSQLDVALQTLEDYGNSFYEELVFQNAEDIARENDRQRSRKTLQRKSWSNDLRRNIARSSVTSRPLSTGFLYMTSSPENTAVWLPQDPSQQAYSVPPDVIPHHQDPKNYWGTMPAQVNRKRNSVKNASIGSMDSGVSLGSAQRDHIELTKTVKHSLTITDSPEPRKPLTSLTRKASLPHNRPTSHPTYRMPPLTPTVATLIHTASATKNAESAPKNGRKIMRQVPATDYSDENPYATVDDREFTKFKSHSTREHRYGSLMSNRGSILKDARFQSLHQSDTPPNRHSWNGDHEEGSTNFGRRTTSNPPVHPIVSPAASYERKQFADGIPALVPNTHTFDASTRRGSKHGESTSPVFTGSMRRGSKQGENGPPPPPRRAATTKLSHDNGADRSRSNSMAMPHSENESRATRLSLPLEINHRDGQVGGVCDSSTDDELPVVPPALPLYNPQSLNHKSHYEVANRSDMDLPAPPPPDVLLCNTMQRMKSQAQRPNMEQDGAYEFPPPPPTL